MKKTILLLSAFLLTFSSLSGCSAKTANTSSDDTQVTTTEEAATEPTTQELVEIDPFEGADFVFAHDPDGDITEKAPNIFSKPEFINNSDDNQYQFLEDSTIKGLEKLNNKGCSISIIREPLNEELKEGDTVTYHLFIDDSIYTNDSLSNVKESYLAEYLAINYGVRLTRTTMKTKIHIEDDPPKEIENIDPFDGYTPTFSFNGYNYWIYNDSPKAELNNKLDSPKMRLEYSVSLAEGLGMNDLWFGDKVKYSIKLLYKGNEYTLQLTAAFNAAALLNGEETYTEPDKAVISACDGQRYVILPENYKALVTLLRKDHAMPPFRRVGQDAPLSITICGCTTLRVAPEDDDNALVSLTTDTGKRFTMHVRGGNIWKQILEYATVGHSENRNLAL